jgi:histidine triad (HIT) family protein
MQDCIFCKISKGEIPCDKIYEDKDSLAFLDIKPVSHGHVLIIPKKHIVWMYEADDEIISEIFILTKKIMAAVKNGLPCDYVTVTIAGNEVPHFHIHLIPRYYNDNLNEFPRINYKDDGHQKEIKEKIIQGL